MTALRHFKRDRVSAILLIVLGLTIVLQGTSYQVGNLTRMGPGFVPVCLGVLIALTGVAIGLTAEPDDFGTAQSTPTEWRGWLCIVGSVAAFVVVGRWGGLVPATFLCVFVASLGDRENTVLSSVALAALITVVGAVIFNVGLKMTFPLFAWG